MYQSIENIFKKKAPLAKVNTEGQDAAQLPSYFRLLADYGITLNAPQQEAVMTVDGPVIVVAGAGSGKTTVLTSRIGYMIHERRIDPSKILLVTFTKKASTEMIERLARIPGIDRQAVQQVTAGTYHSICLRILREQGYNFRVLSNEKQRSYVMKGLLRKMNLQDAYSAEAVLSVISQWKNERIRPQDVHLDTDMARELKELYLQYEDYKERENLYDFDDLLLETYYLLSFRPDILRLYEQRFHYILADEFQDTSFIQYEIIRMLAEPHNNLCIVGDDAQTIYSFRSANSEFMLNFSKQYPSCKGIIMDINYRSTANVVGLGNEVIRHNKKQIQKTLQSVHSENHDVQFHRPETPDEEAMNIVQLIKAKMASGTSLAEIAVLYRTHANGRAIFDKLLEADIPFVTYAKRTESFYENSFVKPVLAVLKCVVNPQDAESAVEAAPLFYISKKDMQNAIDMLYMSGVGNQVNWLKEGVLEVAEAKSGFQKDTLIRKAHSLSALKDRRAAAAVREIRKGELDYERQLEVDGRKTLTLHKEMVMEVLDEMEQAARGFDSPASFLSFIERVNAKNKEMEELRKIPDLEAVKLMTIHTSKGLEFDNVFAIGWCEKVLPHASSISSGKKEDSSLSNEQLLEEERRLAYVAITRAKRHLYLSSPKQQRGKEAEVSRFVEESLGINGRQPSSIKEKVKIN